MRLAVLALLAVTFLVGCGGGEPAEDANLLTVRAVYMHPEFEGLAASFDHEAIPDLMDAMQMTFPVADANLLQGLLPGQKVTLTISQEPTLQVVEIKRLPDDTELVLGSGN